jgi:dipeptidase E
VKFIAVGGGNNGGDFDSHLEKKIRSYIHKENPKVVFVPYASEDFIDNYQEFFTIYKTLGCEVALLQPGKESLLTNADLIYFGRGWTISLLEKLYDTNSLPFLKQAMLNGTILAGFSAGAHALFTFAGSYEQGIGYTIVEGLGLIKGCIMTHYNYKERAEAYHNLLDKQGINGIGLEDHTMLIVEENRVTLYTSKEENTAYIIEMVDSTPLLRSIKGEQVIIPF